MSLLHGTLRCLLVCVPYACEALAPPAFSLEIQLAKPVTSGSDEVRVKTVLTNVSAESIRIATGGGPSRFTVSVTNADTGASVPRIVSQFRYASFLEGNADAVVVIELGPGERLEEGVNVDSLFDLSQQGNYNIQLSVQADASVRSNVLRVSFPSRPTARAMVSESAMRMLPAQAVGRLPIPSSQWPLELSIEMDDEAVYVGKHIPLHTTLSNKTDRTLQMNMTGGDYVVEARDVATGDSPPDKSLNTIRPTQVAAAVAPGEPQSISPKFTVVGTLDLQYYVELSKPGIYAIQLWRKLPDSLGGGEIRSNVLALTVVAQ